MLFKTFFSILTMQKGSFSFLQNEKMITSSSGEKVFLSRINWNVQVSVFNYKSATLGSLWGGKGQFYGRPQSLRFGKITKRLTTRNPETESNFH